MSRLRVAMIIRQGIQDGRRARRRGYVWRLANQLQVAQGSIIGEAVSYKSGLIEPFRIEMNLPCEGDHVVQVDAPFARSLAGVRHGWPPARYGDGIRDAVPFPSPSP